MRPRVFVALMALPKGLQHLNPHAAEKRRPGAGLVRIGRVAISIPISVWEALGSPRHMVKCIQTKGSGSNVLDLWLLPAHWTEPRAYQVCMQQSETRRCHRVYLRLPRKEQLVVIQGEYEPLVRKIADRQALVLPQAAKGTPTCGKPITGSTVSSSEQ